MQTTYLLLKIDHTQPLPDLCDMVANRAYTLDKVEAAEASILVGGVYLNKGGYVPPGKPYEIANQG
jgi:hypothetical protein